jgi:uncharacterized protein YbaR (Trm112 family)
MLKILVCPKCKGQLTDADSGSVLSCPKCSLKYPVRDGVPVMLVEEALDTRTGTHGFEDRSKVPAASFKVIAGPDAGFVFHLERGTCRALGRTGADVNKTAVFNVDLAMELDEGTKRLVLEYISKQFRRGNGTQAKGESLGNFRRMPDVALTDSSLSRLHAMIFYDVAGIGVLDLVSKNGTYVNGKEIESMILNKGDVLEMGESRISFILG